MRAPSGLSCSGLRWVSEFEVSKIILPNLLIKLRIRQEINTAVNNRETQVVKIVQFMS